MSLGKRILLGIVFGCAFATLILLAAFNLDLPPKVSQILLWNVKLFVKLAGNGPLLGYDQQGNPMYEGTPVHLFFGLIGIVSTFPIYSTIFYIIITALDKLNFQKKTKELRLNSNENPD